MRIRPVVLVFALVGIAAGRAPDLFDELFAKAAPVDASMKTVRARFVETTTSALLKDPLVARGTLSAERPARLRLDYETPEKRTLIVDEYQLVMDWPSRSEHTVRDITQVQERVKKYFGARDPAQLRSHFEISAMVDPAVAGTWRVDMLPKRKQIREGLSGLQIWIDQRTLFMRQLEMNFASGESKTFALEDVQLNAPLPKGVFDPGPVPQSR
jgi:outer membrane lipoprotein-sorting protein